MLLHGCGVNDGTEITEAVSIMINLSKAGAYTQCFAPNRDQAHVIDHLSENEQKQTRNVLQESARIARGNCKDLKELKATDFDVLIIPGGFGVAKNLSDFAFKGKDMTVKDDVANVLREFHSHNKVIGMTCIAPLLAA